MRVVSAQTLGASYRLASVLARPQPLGGTANMRTDDGCDSGRAQTISVTRFQEGPRDLTLVTIDFPLR